MSSMTAVGVALSLMENRSIPHGVSPKLENQGSGLLKPALLAVKKRSSANLATPNAINAPNHRELVVGKWAFCTTYLFDHPQPMCIDAFCSKYLMAHSKLCT